MKSILKICILFIAFVFFLSINIKGKNIFSHINHFISPVTKTAQDATEDFLDSSIHSTKSYSKRIFDNSVPKVDAVKAKMSGVQKNAAPLEVIKASEKEELDELIKSHR